MIEITEVADGRVRFGATVTLEDIESGDQETYTIVGEDEADAKLGKISVTSPIARAMIGKEQDSTVSVQVPKGKREFEILGVEYKV